jgi:hypothetical protein
MLVYGVRASVGRVTANASSVPSFDPLREAGARTDNVLVTPACSIATFHRAAPARCGAFADERRIVARRRRRPPKRRRNLIDPLRLSRPRGARALRRVRR